MRLKFSLIIVSLMVVGLLLLVASYAYAADSSQSPPGWAWGAVAALAALLIGMLGYLLRRWMERREAWGDSLQASISAMERRLDARLDVLEIGQARIEERIQALPCRAPERGNGIPNPPRCVDTRP